MTEGSLITDVRELSSRASVIDLKGDVTASAGTSPSFRVVTFLAQ
ncbi:MAG TPA: hypothetical protein VG499_16050 [Actinomycetota bacterium]|nr:hypothetical protein [Actinomycetota bacterium]